MRTFYARFTDVLRTFYSCRDELGQTGTRLPSWGAVYFVLMIAMFSLSLSLSRSILFSSLSFLAYVTLSFLSPSSQGKWRSTKGRKKGRGGGRPLCSFSTSPSSRGSGRKRTTRHSLSFFSESFSFQGRGRKKRRRRRRTSSSLLSLSCHFLVIKRATEKEEEEEEREQEEEE